MFVHPMDMGITESCCARLECFDTMEDCYMPTVGFLCTQLEFCAIMW